MTHELKTGGDRGYLRIATEEAFATQEQLDAIMRLVKEGRADKSTVSLWGFYGTSPSERTTFIRERLLDVGPLRIQAMDEAGIDKAVLALTSPGTQSMHDVDEAKRIAGNANDQLKDACERYPDRFYGMIAVAPLDPQWSAEELRRGKEELGFHGVQINSHTHGHYLDEEQFDPILRACADLDLPLYIHPQGLPDSMIGDMANAGLDGAVYGFGVETSYHALRLLTTGVFDRYPSLQLMLGHGCEGLPFWLYRTDYMHKAGIRSQRYPRLKPLQHDLFHYMRSNVLATNSGLPFGPAIKLMIEVMGEDRVMYAMDYPYEYVPDEVRWMDGLEISDAQKTKFFQTNAERWFKLLGRGAMTTYAVTGATGKLGRLVLDELLRQTDAGNVVALARDPTALQEYDQLAVQVRQADYDDAASLQAALRGVDRVLLISGNAVGQRERQHGTVIEAAKAAGAQYLAYTSILNAQASRLALAPEHVATEKLLERSGLNHDVLRMPWYSENYVGALKPSIEHGAIYGATGDGKLATASRADLAAAAVGALLNSPGGKVHELAGSHPWTMTEFAEEVSRQAGKPVKYVNQSEADYTKTLEGAGLPPPIASLLASTSYLAGEGELYSESKDLSELAGRPSTPIQETIRQALSN